MIFWGPCEIVDIFWGHHNTGLFFFCHLYTFQELEYFWGCKICIWCMPDIFFFLGVGWGGGGGGVGVNSRCSI